MAPSRPGESEMTAPEHRPVHGFTDTDLATVPTVFRSGLLKGQTWLVSGAGSGIGKAIAALAARLGADLAICGRNPEKLDTACAFLEGLGADVLAVPTDIRDPEAVGAFVNSAFERFGTVDHLVNNAGGQFAQSALEFSPGGWRAVIDTNLTGTWYMMQAAARHWVAAGAPGAITSIVASVWRGRPTVAHTAAARAGVIYLSKSVAVEWAPHRIRVNCIAPGVIETAAFGQYPPEGLRTFREDANPMRHPGDAWPAGRPDWFSPR